MTALYSIRPWEREPCIDCKYLPQCRGGCRSCGYITRRHEGDEDPYDSIYCRKDFFEATFPKFLEALYCQEGITLPARRLPGTSC
jgi:sulfatase maturation enzyme AslB (radical SAM superfamily)